MPITHPKSFYIGFKIMILGRPEGGEGQREEGVLVVRQRLITHPKSLS